jgi:sulfite exporter TauE/SafE
MDIISSIADIPLYMVLFTGASIGFASSAHCIGMCGGLVTAIAPNPTAMFLYQVGRLLGYLGIGLMLPLLGFQIVGLQGNKILASAAALTLGLTFLFIGLKKLFRWNFHFKSLRSLERLNQRIWGSILKDPAKQTLTKPFMAGLVSVLLPCGLLWMVLITSLTAVSPVQSFAFISSFWLGTVPALTFAPQLLRKVLTPIQKRLPRLVPVFFIALGLITISTRVYAIYNEASGGGHSCH